jgi:hypothetical protein
MTIFAKRVMLDLYLQLGLAQHVKQEKKVPAV